MRESEVRSARFGELLETLMDHPDPDEITRREMDGERDDEIELEDEPERKAETIEAMNEPLSEEELKTAGPITAGARSRQPAAMGRLRVSHRRPEKRSRISRGFHDLTRRVFEPRRKIEAAFY